MIGGLYPAGGYPGGLSIEDSFEPIPGCMNETLRAYINDQLSLSNTDLEPLIDRWLDIDTNPDKTVAFHELILDTGIEN